MSLLNDCLNLKLDKLIGPYKSLVSLLDLETFILKNSLHLKKNLFAFCGRDIVVILSIRIFWIFFR